MPSLVSIQVDDGGDAGLRACAPHERARLFRLALGLTADSWSRSVRSASASTA